MKDRETLKHRPIIRYTDKSPLTVLVLSYLTLQSQSKKNAQFHKALTEMDTFKDFFRQPHLEFFCYLLNWYF
jgi:hypothetical protein